MLGMLLAFFVGVAALVGGREVAKEETAAAALKPVMLALADTTVIEGYIASRADRSLPLFLDGIPSTFLKSATASIIQAISRHSTYVNIALNTPGGAYDQDAITLLHLMDRLVDQGVAVNCYVDGYAASMGAIILSHCNHRYATLTSYIMWHAAKTQVSGQMNEQGAYALGDSLHEEDQTVWASMRAIVNDDAYWIQNFNTERLVPATELAVKAPDVVQLILMLTVTT